MQRDEFLLLKQTYDEKYGLQPRNDFESIRKLHSIYSKVMGIEVISQEEKDGIGEYYRKIQKRNQPAYYWILDAIHITSRKSKERRIFRYMIKILKNWMNYGYGYVPSEEEAEITSYFEDVVGTSIPSDIRYIIGELMSSYGAVTVTRMIGELKDYSTPYAYMSLLRRLLEEREEEKIASPTERIQYPSKVILLTNNVTDATNNDVSQLKNTEAKDSKPKKETAIKFNNDNNKTKKQQRKLEAELIELYLKEMGYPVKIKEIFNMLETQGINVPQGSRDRLMKIYAEMIPNIIKCDRGTYKVEM